MDLTPDSPAHSEEAFDWPGPRELDERLSEEIGRAERHGTGLSCLLIVIENLEQLASELGSELREQTYAYMAGALRGELRRFDRVGMPSEAELLVILPGADGPRGEIVARRVLDRLQAIKVEARGRRSPLRVAVGLAAWASENEPAQLIERARAAARRGGGDREGGFAPAGPGRRPADPSQPPHSTS